MNTEPDCLFVRDGVEQRSERVCHPGVVVTSSRQCIENGQRARIGGRAARDMEQATQERTERTPRSVAIAFERPGGCDDGSPERETLDALIQQPRLTGANVAHNQDGPRPVVERLGDGRKCLPVHPFAANQGRLLLSLFA